MNHSACTLECRRRACSGFVCVSTGTSYLRTSPFPHQTTCCYQEGNTDIFVAPAASTDRLWLEFHLAGNWFHHSHQMERTSLRNGAVKWPRHCVLFLSTLLVINSDVVNTNPRRNRKLDKKKTTTIATWPQRTNTQNPKMDTPDEGIAVCLVGLLTCITILPS